VNDTVLISDPKTDADVGSFFDRLPETDYLPTWYDLRIDPAKALEEWPDVDREGRVHPENAHIRSAEASAAKKAAKHAGTPTVAHLDSLGRTFLTIADNGDAGNYETRVELDIEGNQRSVMDARGRTVMTYDYDLLGGQIHQASMEAGDRWMLNDVMGKPIYGWDSRGHRLHHQYDAVRRPTQLSVNKDLVERLAEQVIYGENQPNDTQLNLRGKAYQQLDGAGIVTNDHYDFKDNLLSARRQFLQNYKDDVDWSRSPELESESFATSTTYDALNRPITLTTPDQSVIRPVYNEANLLNAVDANLQGKQENNEPIWTPFVKNIDYNEKGQREIIEYGNDARTNYTYDPKTFRLTHLSTTRTTDRTRLQDLRYTYDPAGNITQISDNAQQTIYFNNQVVSPTANYVYDAIYRLIAADGREHIGQVTTPQPTWDDKFQVNLPHSNDGQAMRRYSEEYQYDAVGNIEQIIHYLDSLSKTTESSGSVAWKRTYVYNELNEISQNNRLTSTTIGTNYAGTIYEQYTYDEHGNMIAMPHLREMVWDFKDQLQRVDLGGGGTAYYVYDAAGQRVRKVIERQNGSRQKERFYLGGVEVYREYSGSGKTVTLERKTLHIMDDRQRIAVIETRTQGDDGSPTQLIRFQLSNHLSSATLELDDRGSIISYEEYYPYGSTSYQAGRSTAEVGLKRYRYTGKERDEETGLSYHGVRYYACWMARWISCDPAGMVDGANLYVYVRNNPLMFADSTGAFCDPTMQSCVDTTSTEHEEALQQSLPEGEGHLPVASFPETPAPVSTQPSSPPVATASPAQQSPQYDPWYRFSYPGFYYETGKHDIFQPVGRYESGSIAWNIAANTYFTISNFATIPFNALSEAAALPDKAIRALGGSEMDVQSWHFVSLMIGVGEINALTEMSVASRTLSEVRIAANAARTELIANEAAVVLNEAGATSTAVGELSLATNLRTPLELGHNAAGGRVGAITQGFDQTGNVTLSKHRLLRQLQILKGGFPTAVKAFNFSKAAAGGKYTISTVATSGENAARAIAWGRILERHPQLLGCYSATTNNCTTIAREILQAGGLKPPFWARSPALLQMWFQTRGAGKP
jgi:RHS repeat-associated protein